MVASKVLIRTGKHPFESYSARTALHLNYFSDNIGNLVYQDATHKLLTTPSQVTTSSHRVTDAQHAHWINEHFDVYVIPLANAFRQGYGKTLQRLTGLIEQLKIPVVILGVGVQADFDNDFSPLSNIREDAKKFVRAVLGKSPSIGVRGETTLAYLKDLGFTDAEVIGCPSMFVGGPNLKLRDLPSSLTTSSTIALTVSPYVQGLNSLLWNSTQDFSHLDYFVQDIATLRMMALGNQIAATSDYLGMPNYSEHPLFANGRAKFHFDVAQWRRDISRYDFSFGTRIHGTITALTSGTPGVLIAHDSRTRELADYFEIPQIPLQQAQQMSSPIQVADHYDPGQMVLGHTARFERFTTFLATHNLSTCFATPETSEAFDSRIASMKGTAPLISGRENLINTFWDKAAIAIDVLRYVKSTPCDPKVKFALAKRYIF